MRRVTKEELATYRRLALEAGNSETWIDGVIRVVRDVDGILAETDEKTDAPAVRVAVHLVESLARGTKQGDDVFAAWLRNLAAMPLTTVDRETAGVVSGALNKLADLVDSGEHHRWHQARSRSVAMKAGRN